jgi:hypothetical protein
VPAGSAAASGLASKLVSPLNYFANGPGFNAEAQQKYEGDIATCMQARGWPYTPRTDSLIPGEPPTIAELGTYRKSVGYAALSLGTDPRAGGSLLATDANASFAASLSPTEQLAYTRDLAGGTNEAEPVDPNPSGCQPKALKSLTADLPIQNSAFAKAWSASVKAVLTSSTYLSAVQAWKSCMATSGFTVSDPDVAPVLAQKSGQSTLAVAGSDFDCQVAVLLPVKQRLEQAQITALVATFPEYAARAAQLK